MIEIFHLGQFVSKFLRNASHVHHCLIVHHGNINWGIPHEWATMPWRPLQFTLLPNLLINYSTEWKFLFVEVLSSSPEIICMRIICLFFLRSIVRREHWLWSWHNKRKRIGFTYNVALYLDDKIKHCAFDNYSFLKHGQFYYLLFNFDIVPRINEKSAIFLCPSREKVDQNLLGKNVDFCGGEKNCLRWSRYLLI